MITFRAYKRIRYVIGRVAFFVFVMDGRVVGLDIVFFNSWDVFREPGEITATRCCFGIQLMFHYFPFQKINCRGKLMDYFKVTHGERHPHVVFTFIFSENTESLPVSWLVFTGPQRYRQTEHSRRCRVFCGVGTLSRGIAKWQGCMAANDACTYEDAR